MMARWWATVPALAVAGLMTGCAATRSTFDVATTQPKAQEQTAGRVSVAIIEVRDLRRFEPAPRSPSTPSLQNPEELKDRAITSRAIARKRGGYGNAMADILLPEGRTVELVVREAVGRALAEQGYAVVDAQSAEVAKAAPMRVDIDQFWAWFTPGFAQVYVEFRSAVTLKGEALTGKPAEIVNSYSIVKGFAITDTEWREVVVTGVDDLVKNVKTVVKAAN